eukprot:m.1500053 g.1500053  ORF g.1500053 m.1500053 type:complete len:537 (+) comp25205_c0_seq34:39-1649(+)
MSADSTATGAPPVKRARMDTDDDYDGVVFMLGKNTYAVKTRMHAENRKRLAAAMRAAGHSHGVIVLKGGETVMRHDTDHECLFRQESYFNWAFGVKEPDMYGAIDIESGHATLFIPRLPEEVAPWIGAIEAPSSFRKRYAVDDVKYTDEVTTFTQSKAADDGCEVHVLYGKNSDSGAFSDPAEFPGSPFKVNKQALFPIIADLRVFKTELELDLMRHVSHVSSAAHVDVMRLVKAGMGEYQLESLFQHYIYYHGGCRQPAYTCICACGPNAAVLHYGHAGAPNDRVLEAGDIALLDMGAEYHCYCSDITCSFPVSGTFTPDQRMIFTGVLKAVRAVEEAMKPGVEWPAMHRLATRVILEHLKQHGLVQGSVDDMVAANLGKIFLPCGLGHFIGLDTHDVGGYLEDNPPRIMEGPFGIQKLRTARTLHAGMCLTVEPGIYFVDKLLDMAEQDPELAVFLTPKLQTFRGFGGVRLEDVVTVTDAGIENYTLCPRTCDEIEAVMAGGQWPPEVDNAPWLFRKWNSPVPKVGSDKGEYDY